MMSLRGFLFLLAGLCLAAVVASPLLDLAREQLASREEARALEIRRREDAARLFAAHQAAQEAVAARALRARAAAPAADPAQAARRAEAALLRIAGVLEALPPGSAAFEAALQAAAADLAEREPSVFLSLVHLPVATQDVVAAGASWPGAEAGAVLDLGGRRVFLPAAAAAAVGEGASRLPGGRPTPGLLLSKAAREAFRKALEEEGAAFSPPLDAQGRPQAEGMVWALTALRPPGAEAGLPPGLLGALLDARALGAP